MPGEPASRLGGDATADAPAGLFGASWGFLSADAHGAHNAVVAAQVDVDRVALHLGGAEAVVGVAPGPAFAILGRLLTACFPTLDHAAMHRVADHFQAQAGQVRDALNLGG